MQCALMFILFFQRVEFCVSSVEVYVHDAVERDIEFLGVLLIKQSLSVLGQPLPDKYEPINTCTCMHAHVLYTPANI